MLPQAHGLPSQQVPARADFNAINRRYANLGAICYIFSG